MNEGDVRATAKRWERQPEEPAKWFAHFDRFRLLGASRTIEETWRQDPGHKGRRPSRQWYENAERWDWNARAEQWDESIRAADEEQWSERRRRFNEKSFAVREKLLDRLEQMLAFPLVETERKISEDGRTVIQVIEPARWSYRDIPGIVKALDSLDDFTETLGNTDEVLATEHHVTFVRADDEIPPPERTFDGESEEEYEEGEEGS